MKKILAGKLLFFIFISCFAQDSIDFQNYSPLVCKGKLPNDFKTELSRLVEQEKQSQKGSNSKEKAQAITFSELSNYQLNNILYSGKVLYGDALTAYVNKVADIILKDDKELRNEIRFYVLKNTDLNAYSTQRGIIFISIGLLAQIESEAQLTFIMCHEIVHYKNNHNLETYKKRQEVFSGGNSMNITNRISNILNYSKENELEADREGLDFFLKTPYGTKELNDLFDVMLYSYLPFDEIAFDSLYFNTAQYAVPKEYFLKHVAGITAEEDVVDSLSTHPNIKKRREAIQSLLETKSKRGGVSFISPEAEFMKIQKIARYEVALAYLQDVELEQAMYTGYLIEKVYGKSLFSDKIISSALYARAKQKNDAGSQNNYISYSSDEQKDDWEKVEGESQAVFHFFYKMPSKELSILAARKLYGDYLLYNEPFFAERFSSMVYDLVNEFDLKKSDFIIGYAAKADTIAMVKEENDTQSGNTKISKINKIKKSKASQEKKTTRNKSQKYYFNAFAEFIKDSLFIRSFNLREDEKLAEEEKDASPAYNAYLRAKRKVIKKHGQGLGIKKMILINPFFSGYIIRHYYSNQKQYGQYSTRNPDISPLEEMEVEKALLGYILEYSKDMDMRVNVIGVTQQASMETEQFNDFQQVITWLSERVYMGRMGGYTYTDQYMDKYVKEYGYLGFCQVIKYNKDLRVVFVLFNIESGGTEFIYERRFRKGKPTGILVQMMLYDVMHQISQDAKKINRLKKKYNVNE